MPSRVAPYVTTAAYALAYALAACNASLALAQDRVHVPEDCGSEPELRAELARLLGPDSASDALPERLHIARVDDRYYGLVLELRDESRALRDPDCRVLFKTAVIVAAAAVDPAVLEQPALASTAAGAAALNHAHSATPQPSPSAAAVAPPQRARANAPWRAGAALGFGAAVALLPRPSPLLELSGSIARGAFGLSLSARYLTGADEQLDGASNHGVSIYGLGGRLCALYDPVDFVRLEAGVALDRLTGRGLGGAVDEVSGSGPSLGLVLEASATPLQFGDARLSLGVSGQYGLVRPSFQITGHGEVYRVPKIAAAGIVRLGWEFH